MAKMKLKTLSGAKKRFKLTKNGKIKRSRAYRRHILTKKSQKRIRGFRQETVLAPSDVHTVSQRMGK